LTGAAASPQSFSLNEKRSPSTQANLSPTRKHVAALAVVAYLRICAINNRWSLDGSLGGNGTHCINHSCEPNCFMRISYGHILFLALRDIHPGEEITLDYVQTYHSDSKRCRCGAKTCRGTINKKSKTAGSKV
jgi:hypothetical protein